MAVPARQTEYETIYILRPAIDEADKTKARERVEGIIEDAGGTTMRFDDWGRRRLSYRIRDAVEARYHEQGVYQYVRYLSTGDVPNEVERNLNILETVLKFMTVKIEADLIPADRLARSDEEE